MTVTALTIDLLIPVGVKGQYYRGIKYAKWNPKVFNRKLQKYFVNEMVKKTVYKGKKQR